MENNQKTKFCKHCGAKIPAQAVVCTACGGQVETLQREQMQQPNVIINNSNTNVNSNTNYIGGKHRGRRKSKWTAFLLCLFLGYIGAHKFYEGKIGMGVLYLFTGGLLGVGWIVDTIALLLKPNPYYV